MQEPNARLQELRQVIERRKKLIQEVDYENGEQNGLECQLVHARAELSKLQAKKDGLKAQSEVKMETEETQQSERKKRHRSKKFKHTESRK